MNEQDEFLLSAKKKEDVKVSQLAKSAIDS